MTNTDMLTTNQLAVALLERARLTNGLDYIRADVALDLYEALYASLNLLPTPVQAVPREEFGEDLLLLLVHLCTGDDEMMDDDTCYALLDAQTDEEACYYTECSDEVYFGRVNALGKTFA